MGQIQTARSGRLIYLWRLTIVDGLGAAAWTAGLGRKAATPPGSMTRCRPPLPSDLSDPAREDQFGRSGARYAGPRRAGLVKLFGVSRITVKRALNELAADRLVTRHRGRGTLVSRGSKIPVVRGSFDTMVESLRLMGLETEVEVAGNRRCPGRETHRRSPCDRDRVGRAARGPATQGRPGRRRAGRHGQLSGLRHVGRSPGNHAATRTDHGGRILVNAEGRRFVNEVVDIAGMIHPVLASRVGSPGPSTTRRSKRAAPTFPKRGS